MSTSHDSQPNDDSFHASNFGSGIIREPIAVVSMAARLPEADNVDEFWQLLISGASAVRPLPESILKRERFLDSAGSRRGTTYSDVGAITSRRPVRGRDIGLEDSELSMWDECHLQFAAVANEAWKQPFQKKYATQTDRCGVFVGHSGGVNSSELVYSTMSPATASYLEDCSTFQQLPLALQNQLQICFQQNMTAGRPQRRVGTSLRWDVQAIADLTAKITRTSGPKMVIESACASSSVALCLAALSLNSGTIDAAIVGGASYNKFDSLILFSQAKSCSGRDSRPFDDAADGLISSEGFVVFVLKRLSDAIEHRDTIHGVITGAGMASDGRGKSLWAPRREGQIESMCRAYRDQEHIARVQYIEAHATSTQVGDATETAALAEFFRKHSRHERLPLGSVKSNLGHTLESAGLVGLLKTILSMKHGTIPASINFEVPNKQIDWDSTPFEVVTSPQPWHIPQTDQTRVAAVNSFGIGGLNVHLVVEQFNSNVHRSGAFATVKLKSQEPIAVVGLGCVLPGAYDANSLSALLTAQETYIQAPPSNRWREVLPTSLSDQSGKASIPLQAGFINGFEFDWRSNRIPPKQVQNANPLQFMLLHAAGDALNRSGILNDAAFMKRTGVIVGTIFGGDFSNGLCIDLRLQNLLVELKQAANSCRLDSRQLRDLLKEFEDSLLAHQPALLDETGSFTSSTLASRITKHFNLMGGAFALDGGVASSEHALIAATHLLRNQSMNAVVCAAGARALDYYSFVRMHADRELPNQANNLQGSAPGEGVVAVVLQLLSEAKKQNRKVLGVVDQVSISSIVSPIQPSAEDSVKLDLERKIGRIPGSEVLVALAANLVNQKVFDKSSQCVNTSYGDLAATKVSFCTGDSVELEATSPEDCKARKTKTALSDPALQMNVHSSTSEAFKTIGCFPGQGSQSDQILSHALLNTPAAHQVIRRANHALKSLNSQPFEQLVCATNKTPLENIWPVQASVLISDVSIAASIINNYQRKFDAFIGHSLGEVAALVVAESISIECAVAFVQARATAVRNAVHDKQTGLLSVSANVQSVQALLKLFVNTLSITHCNTPTQTVVGGQSADLQQLKHICSENKIGAIELNVPAAFHCSILEPARWELLRHVRDICILPPKTPVLSTVTGRFVADPEEIRQNLIDQLVTPIDYVRDIQRLQTLGAKEFVELGPGNVLSKLNRVNAPSASALTSDEFCRTVSTAASSLPSANSPTSRVLILEQNRHQRPNAKVFDATASRRLEMRNKSEKTVAAKPTTAANGISTTRQLVQPQQSADLNANRLTTQISIEQKTASNLDRTELQHFIIDFIVEHTGYPLEMIDSKWDLEADLGVDSIKQAQLFGELRQTFDLDPTRFRSVVVRTIDDICDAIVALPSNDSSAASYLPYEPVLEDSSKEITVNSSAATDRIASYTPNDLQDVLVDTTIFGDESRIQWSEDQLNDFMIDFVVEHTGYPPDMVDLDAQFESDLGLDSIKLAQLVGEIRSSFNLELTQEDRKAFIQCRTLRDISQHLMGRSQEIVPAQSVTMIKSAPPALEPEYARPFLTDIPSNSDDDDFDVIKKKLDIASSRAYPSIQTPNSKFSTESGNSNISALGNNPPARISESSEVARVALTRSATSAKMREAIARANSFEAERKVRFDYLQRRTELPLDFLHADAKNEVAAIPDALSKRVTQRYEMRVQFKPIEEPVAAPRFFGRALIVGENRIADELADRLQELKVDFVRLTNATSSTWADQFESHWQDGVLPHLFITSSHDEDAKLVLNERWWLDRSDLAINDLFWLCQRWYKLVRDANMLQDASLLATPNLGGDFGFTKKVEVIEGGAIGGMIKALIIECWMAGERRLNFKLVDLAPKLSRVQCVDAMLAELSYGSYDTEIAYSENGRGVVRAISKSGITKAKSLPQLGDVWICTGGARGITSFACQALAKRYGIRLNLIGMTSLVQIPDTWRALDDAGMRALKLQVMNDARKHPARFNHKNPLKVWQSVEKTLEIDATLKKMRADGIEVEYHACDCADWSAVERIVAKIREEQGPIRGILHGAGVGQDSRFDRKQPVKVNECFAAKMGGALSLLQAVDRDALRYFIAFGSISGRFGANGHTDYSAANDGLIKICDWMRDSIPHARTIGFHWHAWGDIGMATKPETKLALESIGMHFMPASEGLDRLIEEIENASNETEVLITDDRYHRAFYPAETVEHEDASHNRSHNQALIDLESTKVTEANRLVTSKSNATLYPDKDPFLVEHTYNGAPLLPVVVDAELIVEAAIEHARHFQSDSSQPHSSRACAHISLNNFEVHAPLKFFCDQPHSISTTANGNSILESIEVRISTNPLNRSGIASAKEKLLCTADVTFSSEECRLGVLPRRTHRNTTWHRPIYSEPTDKFHSGAPFRLIQRFSIAGNEIFADLTSPSFVEFCGLHRNAIGWRVPSAILDASLFACGILSWQSVRPGICLPTAFQHLNFYRNPRPGKRVAVLAQLIGHDENSVSFDFDVFDDEGNIYIAARGYRATFVHE